MSETPTPAPVQEDYNVSQTHVRTVANGAIVMSPFEQEYQPSGVEMAPESRAILGKAVDIMQCRELLTEETILTEADLDDIRSQGRYLDNLSDSSQQDLTLAA